VSMVSVTPIDTRVCARAAPIATTNAAVSTAAISKDLQLFLAIVSSVTPWNPDECFLSFPVGYVKLKSVRVQRLFRIDFY
ncbi:MAG: hypothetical protein ACREQV_01580, partial [Candidatus Binatia bacterium]